VQRRAFTVPEVLLNQVPHNSGLGTTAGPGMAFQQLDLMPFHFKSYRFHWTTVILWWQ
jgi:hypothetical protein